MWERTGTRELPKWRWPDWGLVESGKERPRGPAAGMEEAEEGQRVGRTSARMLDAARCAQDAGARPALAAGSRGRAAEGRGSACAFASWALGLEARS